MDEKSRVRTFFGILHPLYRLHLRWTTRPGPHFLLRNKTKEYRVGGERTRLGPVSRADVLPDRVPKCDPSPTRFSGPTPGGSGPSESTGFTIYAHQTKVGAKGVSNVKGLSSLRGGSSSGRTGTINTQGDGIEGNKTSRHAYFSKTPSPLHTESLNVSFNL